MKTPTRTRYTIKRISISGNLVMTVSIAGWGNRSEASGQKPSVREVGIVVVAPQRVQRREA